MQTNETYADRIDEDYEEDDEEQADTQDDEIILVDDDDDEADEDMDLDDEEIVRSPSPPPSNLEQAHQEPNDRATVHVHGPIQTVNLTSFLESPIVAAPSIRPPQRYSVGSYDNTNGSSGRRRFSLPRANFPSTLDNSRRSSIMSTGSSVDYTRQSPTRRFSFSSPSTIHTQSTTANPGDVQSSSDEGAATSSDANPLTWDFRRLR
ncbi:hypothetical protein H310_04929 [Aphanomyces invadans]|uniref:Uncharacterized protein n=1 Tax=Aphanomyces invadans TaxID=157072 RepID=A0A024UCZ4_9STRA|nr:hypothetical protein H310_04929 [Aphanomyces invadans]ETW03478.1 hypothetical protein H310_04929 [Aphanomyces invadans]|eukprot:XP_008867707.1 hypothetical protein H310_04929 [Aphanomyces invadans]